MRKLQEVKEEEEEGTRLFINEEEDEEDLPLVDRSAT
jgi:hypothetical protein